MELNKFRQSIEINSTARCDNRNNKAENQFAEAVESPGLKLMRWDGQ